MYSDAIWLLGCRQACWQSQVASGGLYSADCAFVTRSIQKPSHACNALEKGGRVCALRDKYLAGTQAQTERSVSPSDRAEAGDRGGAGVDICRVARPQQCQHTANGDASVRASPHAREQHARDMRIRVNCSSAMRPILLWHDSAPRAAGLTVRADVVRHLAGRLVGAAAGRAATTPRIRRAATVLRRPAARRTRRWIPVCVMNGAKLFRAIAHLALPAGI